MNWESNVRKVVPYVPGEQPTGKVIKLNTNENPYPPAPGVEALLKNFDVSLLKKYPEADCHSLTNALAEKYNVKPSQVFVGVGSDDVLAMAFLTFFNSDKSILFPDITYSFYDVWASLFKIPYEQIPLDDEFRIHAGDYTKENGGVVIANPNAPTGVFMGLESGRFLMRTVMWSASLMKLMLISVRRVHLACLTNMTTFWLSRHSVSPDPWRDLESDMQSVPRQ